EALYKRAVGMRRQVGGHEPVEIPKLGDQRREHTDHHAHQLRTGFTLLGTGMALGRGSQTCQQFGSAPSPAVVMECEEALEPSLTGAASQAGGMFRTWELVEKGQGDGTVDVGEDRRGTGP